MDIFIEFMMPVRCLVESLPVLRHMPGWFPGAGFECQAAEWRKDVLVLRMENLANGTARPCIVTSLLDAQTRLDETSAKEHEELSRNLCALAYITGANTTFASVVTFFLAMAEHAEVQRLVLDAIVEPNRLPNFEDRDSLPYVKEFVEECLRWHVVVTVGIPHRTIADDVCNGYYITKGTVIVTNAWGLSRDTEEYSDPDEFKPDRFLDPNTRDPMAYVFGNSRRICAGRHFADAFVFIIVASVLHTLNIERPFDANGKPVRSPTPSRSSVASHLDRRKQKP